MEVTPIGFVFQPAIWFRASQYPNPAVPMAALLLGLTDKNLTVSVSRSDFWRFPLCHAILSPADISKSALNSKDTASLPYFYEALETPIDDEHFWEQLQEIWEFVHSDLMDVRFESEEAALGKAFRDSRDPDDLRLDSLGVARYRDTDDRDNLMHFHGMGLDALGETEVAIAERKMSAHFMSQWSILLSCHGFVAAAMMARGTDVAGKRAGRAGGRAVSLESQQRWFSHYYLRERAQYRSRPETELAVWRLINAIVEGTIDIPEQFPVSWFEKCLNLEGSRTKNENYGQLTYAFRQNRLSEKRMQQLIEQPSDDLPPLNLEVPRP